MAKLTNVIVLTMVGVLLAATTIHAEEEQKHPEALIGAWDVTSVTIDGAADANQKESRWTMNADGTIRIGLGSGRFQSGKWYVAASGELIVAAKEVGELKFKWAIEDDRLRLSVTEEGKAIVVSLKRFKPDRGALSDDEKAAEAAVRQFLKHLEAGDADEAFALVAISDKMPKEYVERRKERFKKFAEEMKAGTWHVSFVEIHSEGRGAVAVTNEDKKNGEASFDLDPLYLVELEGKWLVLPGITSHRDASLVVSEEEYKVFEPLEKWFNERKDELR